MHLRICGGRPPRLCLRMPSFSLGSMMRAREPPQQPILCDTVTHKNVASAAQAIPARELALEDANGASCWTLTERALAPRCSTIYNAIAAQAQMATREARMGRGVREADDALPFSSLLRLSSLLNRRWHVNRWPCQMERAERSDHIGEDRHDDHWQHKNNQLAMHHEGHRRVEHDGNADLCKEEDTQADGRDECGRTEEQHGAEGEGGKERAIQDKHRIKRLDNLRT
mmetsp:Transcript_80640/g.160190  ORF Transcript_80640/g.160190 Transcript_80640/m.160190 type:complete len:227 (+) Transcript_80640:275-955(+)